MSAHGLGITSSSGTSTASPQNSSTRSHPLVVARLSRPATQFNSKSNLSYSSARRSLPSLADLNNQQRGMGNGIGSLTSPLSDELLMSTLARLEVHRTSSLPLRPLWMNPAAVSRRMQKAACAPFGRFDAFNLSGIATLNMFPYQAFGGSLFQPPASHETNTPTSIRISLAVISQIGPVGSRGGPGGAASPDIAD